MNEKPITENFSKKKRGRPLTLIGEWSNDPFTRDMSKQIIDGYSYRSYENELYRIHAIKIICNMKEGYEKMRESMIPYKWLVGEGNELRGKKRTILTELGRLHFITNNDNEIIELAKLLCETKPNTQQCVKYIREYRLQLKNKLIIERITENFSENEGELK